MATYQQSLETALEAVVSNATTILQFLKQNRTTATTSHIDPLEGAAADVRLSRSRLAEGATSLVQLATTAEEYLDHLANNYQELTCVRWLIKLNILEFLPQSGQPIKYQELADLAGVPEKQLKSVARMAVVNDFLREPRPGYVAHARASSLLIRDDNFMSWAKWMVDYSIPVALKLADATKLWGETDAKDQTAFQVAMNTKEPFFDHLRKSPELTSLFSGYMKNVTASWPWSLEHAVEGFDWASLPHGATVVDIGGSHGQLAVSVARKVPHLNFIVQDLPETVATAEKSFNDDSSIEPSVKARIRFMPHDFFQPQPIVDAEVYFLRMIIHDWPDKDAKIILQHLYSVVQNNPGARVVLMDTVLPPPGSVSVLHEQQLRVRDLMMMSVFNAKERELEAWQELVENIGMEISEVRQPRDSVMGILTTQISGTTSRSLGSHAMTNGSQTVYRSDSPLVEHSRVFQDSTLPVLIIGAGIGGLCLAQALHKAGISFMLFERDNAIDARPQGYRLKLEANAAQALCDSLPKETYEKFRFSCAVTSVGETDLDPFTAEIAKSRAGGGLSGKLGLTPTYTVDRRSFRTMLMSGIEERIVLGKELESYSEQPESSSVVATFKDGTSVRGRFLVGADGLHSAVRCQHIPAHHLVDTEAICVYGKTPLTREFVGQFPAKGLRWMTVVSDTAPMLQSCLIGEAPVTLLVEPIRFSSESRAKHPQLLPPDYVYWALIGPQLRLDIQGDEQLPSTAQTTTQTSDNEDPIRVTKGTLDSADLTMSVTQEWHPSIQALFELQDRSQATAVRVCSALPHIATWNSSPMVTLLGDAVHPMSPCGGVGANTALCDASELASVLIKATHSKSLDVAAIAGFEERMRGRALKSILRSEIGSKKMFGQKNLTDCSPWAG